VLGGKVAADAASGKLSQWALGATWTRMVAAEGKGVVGGLSGQQVCIQIWNSSGVFRLHLGKVCWDDQAVL
jgi:hypothetical protein